MVDYLKLGYSSLANYSTDFLDTLLDSNHTYDFYVKWEKVFANLENHLIEISILNSLNKVPHEELEIKFKDILKNYPEVVPILPSILAIREKKVPIFNINDKSSRFINFSKNNFEMGEVIEFSIETGLLELFNNIDDLYSYLVGTEVGLDTNARKNRSGHIFENAVGTLLEEKLKDVEGYSLIKEVDCINVRRNKRFDYVIYENDVPKFAFE